MTVATEQRAILGPATIVALAFAVFIVYGSLFPFEFASNRLPFEAVFDEWNPMLRISDAMDNILLFVPFGTALWFACRTPIMRWMLAGASWGLLGIGLQLLQLFVPSRVASMADAVNNAIGILVGMALGRALGPWLQRNQLIRGRADPFAFLLVTFWYCYESFPFLPTLDIGLLADHIKPIFSTHDFEPLRLFRHTLSAVLGMLLLLEVRPLLSRRACVVAVLMLLLVSEVLVPYGTLRIETLIGIVLGAVIGERLNRSMKDSVRWAVLMLAFVALTMTVTTEFRGPSGTARFTLTPFSHLLWQGTTIGIPTAAFEALAIGALLWAGVKGSAPHRTASWRWPVVVVISVATLEGVRVALASGPADTSMVVTSLVLAPFAAASQRRMGVKARPNPSHREMEVDTARQTVGLAAASDASTDLIGKHRLSRRAAVWQTSAVLLILTLGLRLLLEMPSVPYNVLELFPERSLLNVGLFSVALLWLGAGPRSLVRWAKGRPQAWLWLSALLPVCALLSLLLLRIAVTQESLDDITGSTDLYRRVVAENYWGEWWRDVLARIPASIFSALERGVRFTALYSLLLVPLTIAVICTERIWPMQRALPALGLLALCWWLAATVVIDGAITDNLTELIAPGGSLWLVALTGLFALQVSLASERMTLRRVLVSGAISVVSLPLSWWLLKQGLEQTILKYGAVWSAQQFLLGRDRTTHLPEVHLFMRWSVVYLAMLGVCTIGMVLTRRLMTAFSVKDEDRSTYSARAKHQR